MADANAECQHIKSVLRDLQDQSTDSIIVRTAYDAAMRRWYAEAVDAHVDWSIRVDCDGGALRNSAEDAAQKLLQHVQARFQAHMPVPRKSRTTPVRVWSGVPESVKSAALLAEVSGARLFVRPPSWDGGRAFISIDFNARDTAEADEAREKLLAAGFGRNGDVFVWNPAAVSSP